MYGTPPPPQRESIGRGTRYFPVVLITPPPSSAITIRVSTSSPLSKYFFFLFQWSWLENVVEHDKTIRLQQENTCASSICFVYAFPLS